MAQRNALSTVVRVLALSFLLGITGCGDFESAFKPSSDAWQDSDEIFTAQVAGSVGDGPIVNARLRVFSNTGELLLETSSNGTADYDLTVSARGRDFPLTVVADQGIDLVTNAAPDFALVSVIMQPGAGEIVNLNPYSTLIVKAAQNAGGLDEATLAAATEAVLTHYGFGLNTEFVPNPLSTEIDGGNVHVIVKASETLGEMIRRTRDALITSGTYVDGDGIVKALAADLSDGWIDGQGAPGHDPRIAAVANVASAAVMVEAMANRLHVEGVDATMAMDNAILQVRPNAPAGSHTRNVPITAEAIDQTLRALRSAEHLTEDPAVSALYAAVAETAPGTTQIQTPPAGSTGVLNDAVLAAAYLVDDTLLEAINAGAPVVPAPDSDHRNDDREPPPGDAGSGTNDSESQSPPPSDGANPEPPPEDAGSGTNDSESEAPPPSEGAIPEPDPVPVVDESPEIEEDAKSGSEPVSGPQPSPEEPPPSAADPVVPDADEAIDDGAPVTLWSNDGWLRFDGVDDRLSTDLSLTELSAGSFTFEAMLQYTGTEARTWSPIFGSSSPTSGGGQILNIGKARGVMGLHIRLGDLVHLEVNAPALFDGSERHLAVVFDQDAREVRVYMDRTIMHRQTGVSGALTSTTSDLLLGAVGHAASERWQGWIGPARVSTQALASAQFLGSDGEPVASRPNAAPVLSGTPTTALITGNPWSFRPTASDPDGDPLTFSIAGQPAWASFDPQTGQISGTPTVAGRYGPITITASDGRTTTSLAPFTLQVDEPTLGTATVSWQPPTTRTDGSALTDLAGYRVYYGKNETELTHVVEINNAGQTSQHIENLDTGTWYFAVTAICGKGLESPRSEVGSKTI